MKFIVTVNPTMEHPRTEGDEITPELMQAWLEKYTLAEGVSFEMSTDPDDPFMEGEHNRFCTFFLTDTKVELVED